MSAPLFLMTCLRNPRRSSVLLLVAFTLAACRSLPEAGGEGADAAEHQTIVMMGSELSGGLFLPAKIVIDYEEGLRTADHRLRVRMNIRNRATSQTQIQVQTIFKDEDWTPVGEMVDWKLIRLRPGETQRYEATSETPRPVRYTVRIRPFR